MEYATPDNTGLLISKLCFGTMTFGDGRGLFKAISTVDHAGADELVKTSIDGGINFFDTTDNYTHSAIMSAAHRKKTHHTARRNPCLSCRTSIPGAPRCW
jgi:aryl-alcohol dehydrogenase-like predicted oxidoreductase